METQKEEPVPEEPADEAGDTWGGELPELTAFTEYTTVNSEIKYRNFGAPVVRARG